MGYAYLNNISSPDSSPIKFWPYYDYVDAVVVPGLGYNNSAICGIFPDCFCQHVNFDEPIILPFTYTPTPGTDFLLKAYDYYTNAELGSELIYNIQGDYYQITITPNDFIGSDEVKVIYFVVCYSSFVETQFLLKSDCIVIGGTVDFPQGDSDASYSLNYDLDCSVTIHYTNSKNFDGILYEYSPQPEFQITVPAQFWKGQYPQDREDIELSNGEIVTLRQGIEQKRLLEFGYMPDHMHLKMQKILMHDTITIGRIVIFGTVVNSGEEFRVRDPYTSDPVNRYGLRKASILLTKFDSVQKNTL